jgi:hypothetical protein
MLVQEKKHKGEIKICKGLLFVAKVNNRNFKNTTLEEQLLNNFTSCEKKINLKGNIIRIYITHYCACIHYT